MYPKLLRLENFLSYSEPTELNFDLFDLAVLTGRNGAGKSSLIDAFTWTIWGKARYKDDDSLISLGKNYMQTEVILKEEKQNLRILRYRKKGKPGKTILEFFISEDNSTWHSLTGKSVRETEERIIQTLKLPYEVFINSSLLKQGKADEFTSRSPSERKAVLSEILLLAEWDRRQEILKEYLAEKEKKAGALEIMLKNYEETKVDEEEIEKEVKKLKSELKELKRELEKLKTELKALRTLEINYSKLESLRERLLLNYKEGAEKLKRNLNALAHLKEEIKKLETLTLGKEKIKSNYQKLQDALESLSKLLETKNKLETLLRAKEGIEKERKGIEGGFQNHKKELFLEIKKEKQSLSEKLDRLEKIIRCPTCFREFRSQQEREITKKTLEKESLQKIRELNEKLKKQEALWQKKDFEFAKKKEELEQKILKLNFDNQAFANLQKTISFLSPYKNLYEQMMAAEKELAEKKTRESALIKEQKELEKTLLSIKEEGIKIQKELTTLKEKIQPLKNLEEKERELTEKEKALIRSLSLKEKEEEEIKRKKEEAKKQKEELKKTKEEAEDLRLLSLACGKNGVQAMIIEEALPKLEEKANLLLQELSNNNLSLSIQTEREKKTGEGIIETLDIIVSDSAGSRPYELFSGGEAFRINLALRIALSILLAERVGSRVEFLIIDEGFGTLDSQGKEALTTTLFSIKKYFQKIIIITHLDELKETFPTEIQVTKETQKSRLTFISHYSGVFS